MPDVKTLDGLTPIAGQGQIIAPRIDVGMIPTVSYTTCPDIIAAAKSSGSKETFLSSYKLNNSEMPKNLQDFYLSLNSQSISKTVPIPAGPNYRAISNYLQTLTNTYIPQQELAANCLREASSINEEEIQAAKETAEESKLRYESMLAPEERVSYYEGWFPLFRPMSEPALFGIFGTSIFILLLSILIFLRMRGVEVQLIIPSYSLDFMEVLKSSKFYIIGGALTGIIVTYVGYRRGWF